LLEIMWWYSMDFLGIYNLLDIKFIWGIMLNILDWDKNSTLIIRL
jgi:hypothetical protein